MTREALSAIGRALDNERCKLGALEDLIATLIDGADAKTGPNPFYSLLDHVQPITQQLADIGEQLEAIGRAEP